MKKIIEHLSDFKWIYIIAILIISPICFYIWYEYAYPCVYGHYEDIWQTTWCYDSNMNMYQCGGYYQNTFICDCRTVRDSIK